MSRVKRLIGDCKLIMIDVVNFSIMVAIGFIAYQIARLVWYTLKVIGGIF